MNKIEISGKVYKISFNESGTVGMFDLMFSFDKEKKQGSFVKIKVFKEAVNYLQNIKEKTWVKVIGWLNQERFEDKNKNKRSIIVIGTKNIELVVFENDSNAQGNTNTNNFQEPQGNNNNNNDIPF